MKRDRLISTIVALLISSATAYMAALLSGMPWQTARIAAPICGVIATGLAFLIVFRGKRG